MRRFPLARRRPRHARRALAGRLLAAVFIALCGTAWANDLDGEAFEQHHAHEHGKVTLNIAVDGGSLVAELDAPAANVVGFEHAPRNATERATAAAAATLIRTGRGIFATPDSARCRFVKTDFTESTSESNDDERGQANGKTAKGGDADHGQEHHADYEARFSYECANPAQLTWIEPLILAKLLNVTEARVTVITPKGQRSDAVKGPHDRIQLR
jgi:uncharacterized protein DUF2796